MARRCSKFDNWIENNALIDIDFSAPKFIWFQGCTLSTQKSARLDRALLSMAKIGWRMMQDPNTLWAGVLGKKFYKGRFKLDCPTYPKYITNEEVADYWQRDTGWRWGDLEGLLPWNVLDQIAAFQVYAAPGWVIQCSGEGCPPETFQFNQPQTYCAKLIHQLSKALGK
ncbi:hypothetical protein Cgig2_033547 [Carnegiea gigantea]|uniref:Uncharacterized protein n=1 Tax=Carnegiea gigantea TaxID=171969 RepID=A0A9Q1K122_9CARY|nr:hypothetical protein Cgig2_033547 [Carnegiea gigantea]